MELFNGIINSACMANPEVATTGQHIGTLLQTFLQHLHNVEIINVTADA